MNIDFQLSTLQDFRTQLVSSLEPLEESKWFQIPEGFNNHIAWQLGHMLVTNEYLLYKNAGLGFNLPESLLAQCRKGSDPREWTSSPDPTYLLSEFTTYIERLTVDVKAGKFTQYESYLTSAGTILTSFEDALSYSYHHEGVHKGTIRAYLRLV